MRQRSPWCNAKRGRAERGNPKSCGNKWGSARFFDRRTLLRELSSGQPARGFISQKNSSGTLARLTAGRVLLCCSLRWGRIQHSFTAHVHRHVSRRRASHRLRRYAWPHHHGCSAPNGCLRSSERNVRHRKHLRQRTAVSQSAASY